jgi:hypothetical protein
MDRNPLVAGILLVLPALISPVVLGILTGRVVQDAGVRRFLGGFGFRTIHPYPTAWDYQFSRAGPFWVIVTLRDGSRVYNVFGYNSFAGDDPSERDLFLEAVYRLTPSGDWGPEEDSGGIIIRGNQLAAIEFRKPVEFQDV